MVSHHGLSLTELVNLWDCFFIFTFQSAVMLYLMKKKLTLYVCLVLICNCNEKKRTMMSYGSYVLQPLEKEFTIIKAIFHLR